MDQVFAWLMGLLSFIPGLGHEAPPSWNGYAELDYVYAAAPAGGTIETIAVTEGDTVAKGDVLFTLDASIQQAQYEAAVARANAARAQIAAAEATLANLRTGARPEELQVTQATLAQAEANLALAQQTFSRTQDLFAGGNVPRSQLDQARAGLDAANASVLQLKAQLAVAQLPARNDQIAAASATVAAAESTAAAASADAANAQAALDNRTIAAPEAGRIERLYYSDGEVAGAGAPVVSIAGDGALRIKFYVNEADRPAFHLGDVIAVTCDGCATGLTAKVDHFASDPQFTPPIIYSRDERSRLVFLTEAVMTEQNGILPGQPVSIGRIE
ncbi:MAG: HlyD family efflux transporter periplasmic adaptor subunit [Devosia sp.]|uniref:HlyD family secretion protein n=1 Tax=Devosia sp. TaxID=1871048 RepID=UPI001A396A1B|nr:HlyD family efflux transporter periplasmic adaptor subunit [Devosia sp.]MBL8598756.1 HlyD family efflux transporter periplasmic adaptor subunit [Devosia sp.]